MVQTPNILLASDMHVGKDNISEFLRNWEEMLAVAEKFKIKDIIINGDLWQSRSAQTLDVLLAVKQALQLSSLKRIQVYLSDGNHCLVDQEALNSYNSIFSEYPFVEVIHESMTLELKGGATVTVMAYFPENGSFASRLKEVIKELNPDDYNILCCHEGIRGGLSTSSDDELPAEIFKPFNKVLVGHYHDRKKIKGTNIEYVGASRQHNFGEDEEKGYTIIYSDGSTKFIKNEVNSRYIVVDVDAATAVLKEFQERLAKLKEDIRYKVKVRVSCSSKETATIDKQKLTEAGATKVELVTEQTEVHLSESQAIDKKFDKSGIKQEYTTFCDERKIDNEMGLQYLDKIN